MEYPTKRTAALRHTRPCLASDRADVAIVFLSSTSESPKRKFGGADFDGFSDLGMGERRNFDPQLSGASAHPEGAPCAAKHRLQNFSTPRGIDFLLHHFGPDVLRSDQDAHLVAGRKSLIAVGHALPAFALHREPGEIRRRLYRRHGRIEQIRRTKKTGDDLGVRTLINILGRADLKNFSGPHHHHTVG